MQIRTYTDTHKIFVLRRKFPDGVVGSKNRLDTAKEVWMRGSTGHILDILVVTECHGAVTWREWGTDGGGRGEQATATRKSISYYEENLTSCYAGHCGIRLLTLQNVIRTFIFLKFGEITFSKVIKETTIYKAVTILYIKNE